MRVGLGFDQRATPKDALDLAVLGAVVEALLGASGLEDAAPGSEDASAAGRPLEGTAELQECVRRIERQNYQVVNLDITVSASMSAPIEPARRITLRQSLAELVHVAPASVSIKERRGRDGLGAAPAAGVTAIAVILLDQIADLDALHASIRSGG